MNQFPSGFNGSLHLIFGHFFALCILVQYVIEPFRIRQLVLAAGGQNLTDGFVETRTERRNSAVSGSLVLLVLSIGSLSD